MENRTVLLVAAGFILAIALCLIPVQAGTVPLCRAGTAFDATKYPQDTPESDPMVVECSWDGTGQVFMSGDKNAITGIYADDGYTVSVKPPETLFDADEHWAHQHPVVELTDGMTKGLNTVTITVQNWRRLSMSYGSKTGIGVDQTPYIVQVVSDPEIRVIPLCKAGTAFDATKYPQNTPESDPMVARCSWDGTGQVFMSGDRNAVTGIYADDGYIVSVQPPETLFDADEHWAHRHPVVELTDGMTKGLNTVTITVQNWQGLSMSYGSKKGIGVDQTPYVVQVKP